MTTPAAPPKPVPHISPPPSKQDVDQVSRDQALIADDWAPGPEQPVADGDKPA